MNASEQETSRFSLPAIALNRPIAVIMLVLSLLLLGWIAWNRIRLEFLPQLEMPFIGCYIPYQGGSPRQVEQEIAIPAEGEFRTISNLRTLTTTSDTEGCWVSMNFDMDVDMADVSAEVRDRIERLKLRLPDEVDDIQIRRYNLSAIPVLLGSVSADNMENTLSFLRTTVQPRLARIDGVAEVSIRTEEDEVLIEFDQDALRRQGLALYELVGRLRTANVDMPLGKLEQGATNYFVRVRDRYERLVDIENILVSDSGLRLKDVATVRFGARAEEENYNIDGQEAVVVFVQKEADANTVEVCQSVRAELDTLMKRPELADARLIVFFDQSESIVSALNGLTRAGRYAAALATAVIFLFLRRVRQTLVLAFIIPASLVAGLVVMFFSGFTLNMITMASLIIAVGLLVDNSIVVIENVQRHLRLGRPPRESALRGASEVAMAITASTLTTAVVFAPLMFMEAGEMSSWMKQFAVPILASLTASLILALTLIPIAACHMQAHSRLYLLIRRYVPSRETEPADERMSLWHPARALLMLYAGLLGLVQRQRLTIVVLIAILGIVTIAVPARQVKLGEPKSMDSQRVTVDFDFEQNFDIARVEETLDRFRSFLEPRKDELGIDHILTEFSSRHGELSLFLTEPEPGTTPPYTTDQVRDILWQTLPKRTPGIRVSLGMAEASQGTDTGERGVAVTMTGDDMNTLVRHGEEFKRILEKTGFVSDVKLGNTEPREEIVLRVDESMATTTGLNPTTIARTVDFSLRGARVAPLQQGNREIPVWTQFREEDRKTKANLEKVGLPGASGDWIALGQLVEMDRGKTPLSISRRDGKNSLMITMTTTEDDLRKLRPILEGLIAEFPLPPGYSMELGASFTSMDADVSEFLTNIFLAIVLVIIVMSALFESCFLPLSIIMTVPLSAIGVYWSLYLTGTMLDVIGFIGCIFLVGIVVNNGIVIVDHINLLRREGLNRHDAVVRAGQDRFRPVMMTALTTILGCLPLYLGEEGGSETLRPVACVIVGGLTIGTLLTLFVVPLVYTFIDDFQHWCINCLAQLMPRRQ